MLNTVFGAANFERIYVIFQVFNLEKQSIGLKIYAYPEAMRINKHLEFTAETWSVVGVSVRG
jgi:hypothetical protein